MPRDLMAEHVKRFGKEKPIIGCLHLRALPGSPMWDRNYTIEQHIADLKREAQILMELGFDGAVFANEWDYPYAYRFNGIKRSYDPVWCRYYE